MRRTLWRLSLLALPAALFGGTVTLSDGVDAVTTTGNLISIGTNNVCSSGCTISGTASISSFLLQWSFTTATGISASGIAPNFTLSGGTGTFMVNDSPDAGSDSVIGTVSLTSATESGVSDQNMTLGGTLTATSLVVGAPSPTTTAFLAIMAQAGITPPVPPTETEGLVINVVNCTNGLTTSCLTSIGLASIEAAGTTGTVSSVGITSAVPEPATMLLMGAGLVGLLVGRRAIRKA